MFVTRFSRVTGNAEDYIYHTREEAESHLKLFEHDDSGLYRNISVIDDTNTVLTILPFTDGRPEKTLRVGDTVKLREQWASPEERGYVYAIRNLNEKTENTIIACLNSRMTLPSTQNVKLGMIEPAE